MKKLLVPKALLLPEYLFLAKLLDEPRQYLPKVLALFLVYSPQIAIFQLGRRQEGYE